MKRLDNHSIALCIYFLEGNVLSINTTIFETLSDDLHDYFDLLRYNIGAKQPALFKLERSMGYCNITVEKPKRKELKEFMTKYVNELVKDNLESSSNVLLWSKELKAFIDKAQTSNYNMKSYNVSVEDMHVILYGLVQNIFKLKKINIIPDEVVPCFYNRDTSGDVETGDISKFHECLNIVCTVDINTYISKQNKKNANTSSVFSAQEDWLYKYICEKTGHTSSSIPMLYELVDTDQTNPNTFPNFVSFKQAYHRLNKRYEKKYGVKSFVKKVKNEDYFRITFAKNDKDNSLL